MYKYIPGHFLFLWLEIILLIINVISLMQKSEVMYNRATVITDLRYLSYPVIFVLLIFSLLMAGCSDDENEEQPPALDVPDSQFSSHYPVLPGFVLPQRPHGVA